MIIPIKIYPDKILRLKAKPVESFNTDELKQLIADMKETMLKKDGMGLAAPQVGQSIRLVVINTKAGVLALINPQVMPLTLRREKMEEGCLSFPKIFGLVKRCRKIKIKAFNFEGKPVNFKASGLLARVIMHEVDHLNGILFIDRAEKITGGVDKLNEMKKNEVSD